MRVTSFMLSFFKTSAHCPSCVNVDTYLMNSYIIQSKEEKSRHDLVIASKTSSLHAGPKGWA